LTKTNFGKYTENKFGRRVITLGAEFTFSNAVRPV